MASSDLKNRLQALVLNLQEKKKTEKPKPELLKTILNLQSLATINYSHP
jgi:hypothetical protein